MTFWTRTAKLQPPKIRDHTCNRTANQPLRSIPGEQQKMRQMKRLNSGFQLRKEQFTDAIRPFILGLNPGNFHTNDDCAARTLSISDYPVLGSVSQFDQSIDRSFLLPVSHSNDLICISKKEFTMSPSDFVKTTLFLFAQIK